MYICQNEYAEEEHIDALNMLLLFRVKTSPIHLFTFHSTLIYSSLAQSVGDREKQLIIVFRREVTKIRSFEAEPDEAHKTTIF